MQVQGFHAVTPKRDCPHCTPENIAPKEEFVGIHVNDKCGMCDNRGENWLCLKPGNPKVYCSRYVNNHMLNFYFENPDHPIVFSFADFSFWCYLCDSYIEHPLLDHTRAFYLQKFGEDDTQESVLQAMRDSKNDQAIAEEDEEEAESPQLPAQAAAASNNEEEKKEEEKVGVDELTQAMSNLNVSEPRQPPRLPEDFQYEDLVNGFKQGKFRRILVLTGAGISVSAGIPDFRSPGTGVYDNLQEYNLPNPEAIFTIDYFKQKPEPFYRFAQHFDLTQYNATPTHYFVKMLQDKGLLWKNLTQNIDNLEQKTGMNMDDVVQAHGANRGAVCSRCHKEHDAEQMQQAIRDQVVYRCTTCARPVKPEIVFFGESLPEEFMMTLNQVKTGVDLCLVMGTALAVAPFNITPTLVKREVPKILFNMNNTKETGGMDFTQANSYKLFVEGKCDELIRKLVADCGWTDDFEAVLPDVHKAGAQADTTAEQSDASTAAATTDAVSAANTESAD